MSTEDFDTLTPGDEEVLAGLHRSVAGATLATSAADVVALGRRTRNRHRAVAAGIGTSAAAIVAAIGVLAPSAGSGAGTNAAGRAAVPATTPGKVATTPGGAQTLDIQEAGFTLQEHADGKVFVFIGDAFDPVRLRAALDKAGVPSAILVQPFPAGWDISKGIQCTPDPGVTDATRAVDLKVIKYPRPGVSRYLEIDKSAIPAGDFLTLTEFQYAHGGGMGTFRVMVGRQTTCVPEYETPHPALQ
jgi:hypothetical protein